MRYLVFLILLLVGGCATTSFSNLDSTAFEQNNVSEKQFTADSARCEMEGEKNRSMSGMGGLAGFMSSYETFNRVYDACMRANGYARKQ